MFNLEYIRHAQRFYALQVPIYYYVKTKGSLVNTQGLSISKTIKMKLTVFEYYDRFFKTVLDEVEYEKSRLKVYRFLVDAAGDGAVPPPLLPGSKKLGDERLQVCADHLGEEGVLADAFRERKLLERYLETAALKNSLSLPEAYLLLCLGQRTVFPSRRELMDFLGLSRAALSMALQKLSARGLLQWEEVREPEGKKQLRFALFPETAPILADLETAQADFRAARLAGFTQEEQEQYTRLSARVQENIRATLQ